MNQRITIGIIGFGRFGKLVTKYLAKDFEVKVFDKHNNNNDEIKRLCAKPSSLEKASKSEIVIPCIPISAFKDTIEKIKPFLKKNAIMIDVCSVKEYPINLMKQILPKNIQILATHPMFGPDSASDSLSGRKIVVCKTRIEDNTYQQIIDYLKSIGLIVIETTPEQHDKDMAETLILTHFIGRGLLEFKAVPKEIDTEGYKRLMHILSTVKNDTWQLFEDMNQYNDYAEQTRKKFIEALNKVEGRLKT